MGSPIDTANYISALHTAVPVFPKQNDLHKTQDKKNERTNTKKPKTFFDRFLEASQPMPREDDYETRLQGLEPSEKKEAINDILAILQDKVFSSGAHLADNITAETIADYKNAVKTFVNFAVKHSLDVKSVVSSGGRNPTKQRNYTIVKIIDKKVEQLTQELLFNQIEKLQILERLDEIKGLLVNLTM